MADLKQFFRVAGRTPTDIVAIHISHAQVLCARLRKSGETVLLQGAACLPALPWPPGDAFRPLSVPKALRARYAALCIPGDAAVVKLLNMPGELNEAAEKQIRDSMGVDENTHRIGYRMISRGRGGRTEMRVLVAAMPDDQCHAACELLPVGTPAPFSVEVDGLAAATAFSRNVAAKQGDDAIAYVFNDEHVSYAAFFLKGDLLLLRKFDFGNFDLLNRVQQNLGVDRSTAQQILMDGSFDVSQVVKAVIEPLVRQLVISKHFVERRENCQLSRIFLLEGAWVAREWIAEIKNGVGVDVDFWNPLDGIKLPNDLPEEIKKNQHLLAVPIGAALGVFSEQ